MWSFSLMMKTSFTLLIGTGIVCKAQASVMRRHCTHRSSNRVPEASPHAQLCARTCMHGLQFFVSRMYLTQYYLNELWFKEIPKPTFWRFTLKYKFRFRRFREKPERRHFYQSSGGDDSVGLGQHFEQEKCQSVPLQVVHRFDFKNLLKQGLKDHTVIYSTSSQANKNS